MKTEVVEADEAVFDVLTRVLYRVSDQVRQLNGDVGGEG